ncbi:MAG TPA: hypothetical protein VLA37_13375, partial [Sphingomonadaceae bacterium]|nr:hypothetical protein [Sphingomonadaceae bacterium]
MKKIVTIAAALVLAACGSERSGTIETGDGDVDYTVDNAGGATSTTLTSDEGEVTITSGAGRTVDMPDGFSVYPGSTIVNSSQVSHADGSGVRIEMQTGDSAEQAIAYYRKQAADQG